MSFGLVQGIVRKLGGVGRLSEPGLGRVSRGVLDKSFVSDRLFVALVVFLSCFVLTFVAGSLVVTTRFSKAITGLGLVGAANMTLTTNNSALELNPVPGVNNGLSSGSHIVTADTNVPTGYNLTLVATAVSAFPMASGTFSSPIALIDNAWGYAVAGAGGFDAAYTAPIPSATSKWASPATSATIKNTTAKATNDQTTIYYAARVNIALRSGTYANTIRYTATANTANISGPTIISIAPNSGTTAGGTQITIVGTGFTVNDESVTTGISIDGVACANVSISSNTPATGQDTITCTTPAHAVGAVDVAVTNWVGTATANNGYTYVVPGPVIALVSPNNGHFRGGETIVIIGSGFAGTSDVSVGGTTCRSFTLVSDTQITCVTPSIGAGYLGGVNSTMTAATNAVSVGVVANSGTSPANAFFTYRYINKSYTTGGSFMDIRGTDIALGSGIYVDGAKCTNLKITSSETATCNTPNAGAGARSVTIAALPASQGNMQNWTGCSAIATPAHTVTDWIPFTRYLTDMRNGQVYRVRKMPDGKCWMIDNLKLANYTLTSADSDVSANFTIPANPVQDAVTRQTNGVCDSPAGITGNGSVLTCDGTENGMPVSRNYSYRAYSDPAGVGNRYNFICLNRYGISSASMTGCGYLYNWYTATAGTGDYSLLSGDAASSICPVGWRLPKGGNSGEFAVLNNAMATGSVTASTTSSAATRPGWQYSGMFEGAFSGIFPNGFSGSDVVYYISSSVAPSGGAYTMSLNVNAVSIYSGGQPGEDVVREVGMSVRCVAR